MDTNKILSTQMDESMILSCTDMFFIENRVAPILLFN